MAKPCVAGLSFHRSYLPEASVCVNGPALFALGIAAPAQKRERVTNKRVLTLSTKGMSMVLDSSDDFPLL